MSSGVVAAVADGGHVVGEGVEPDVDDVFLLGLGGGGLGDGDAPGEAGAGDGEVAEVAGNVGLALRGECEDVAAVVGFGDVAAEEAEDFVFAGLGLDVEGVGLDEVDEGELVVAEAEEEVLFGDGLGGLAVGAEDAGRAFDEDLLADGVLAGVGAEVDLAALVEVGEEASGRRAGGGARWCGCSRRR